MSSITENGNVDLYPPTNDLLLAANDTLAANISSEYDYDYDAAIGTLYWDELAPPLLVYSFTYLVGIIGNGLLLFTIARYRKLTSTTNVFLGSLATTDLMLILLCIPVKVTRLFAFSWTLGFISCKLIYYMQAVSVTCSVYTMTAMSIERFYAIVHPLKSQYMCTMGKAKMAAAVVWILSFVLAVPILWVQVHMGVGSRRPAFWCVRDFDSTYLWPTYETYNLILILILPGVVMATAYICILQAVLRMTVRKQQMTRGSDRVEPITSKEIREDKTVRQVIRMLLVVVSLFVICWTPILVVNVLQSYNVLPAYGLVMKHIRTSFDLLSYCNSCMNPIVYGFMSENFREAFHGAFTSMFCRTQTVQYNSRSSSSKTTNRITPGTVEANMEDIVMTAGRSSV